MNFSGLDLSQFSGSLPILAYLVAASFHVSSFISKVRAMEKEVTELKRSHGEIHQLQVSIAKIETSLLSIQESLSRLVGIRDKETLR